MKKCLCCQQPVRSPTKSEAERAWRKEVREQLNEERAVIKTKVYAIFNEFWVDGEEKETVEYISAWENEHSALVELTLLAEKEGVSLVYGNDEFKVPAASLKGTHLKSDEYYIMEWDVQSHG